MSALVDLGADLALPSSPAKFSNNLKIATMAAVRGELGGKAGFVNYVSIVAAATIALVDLGKAVRITGTVAVAVNLPTAVGLVDGAGVTIVNSNPIDGVNYTVTAFGAQTISAINTPANTMVLQPGDSVDLIAFGGNWVMSGGVNVLALSRSQGFAATLAASGYQKLPSGLIMQWGTTGSIASGGTAAITFPVAFATAVYSGSASVSGNSAGSTPFSGEISSPTTSGFNMLNLSSGSAAFFWIVIGK